MTKNSSLLSREQAEPILAPLVDALQDGFFDADGFVEDVLSGDPRCRFIFDSSTRAAMLSNAFGHFVQPLVHSLGVNWNSRGRRQFCDLSAGIRLRFKKLTTDLFSMNIPTEEQRKEYEQELVLDNARRVTVVTFGYTLNEVTSMVTGLHLVCPTDWRQNLWRWTIYEADDGQLPLFGSPVEPVDPNWSTDEDTLAADIKINVSRKEAP